MSIWENFEKLKWVKQEVPILVPGEAGAWDDFATITPFIFPDKEGYLLFYTGQSYAQDWAMGLARSTDLIHWKKDSAFSFRAADGGQSCVDGVSIFFHNGRYYLFYEAKQAGSRAPVVCSLKSRLAPALRRYLIFLRRSLDDALARSLAVRHAYERHIRCFVSEDLLHWQMEDSFVVLDSDKSSWDLHGVFSPRVFDFKNQIFLFYGGSDGEKVRVGLATSSDLKQWHRMQPSAILCGGPRGSWDENHVLMVDVIAYGNGFLGFYEGEARGNAYGIGLAYSNDLLRWEKFSGNPILSFGKKDSFDEKMVCSPHVIIKNGKYFLFYSGHNRFMQGCCGLAIGQC